MESKNSDEPIIVLPSSVIISPSALSKIEKQDYQIFCSGKSLDGNTRLNPNFRARRGLNLLIETGIAMDEDMVNAIIELLYDVDTHKDYKIQSNIAFILFIICKMSTVSYKLSFEIY